MSEQSGTASYTIREGVLTKIAAAAALGTTGVAGKKGRGIIVKHVDGIITADVHIQVVYGAELRTLALTVQQNVAKALEFMAAPQRLEVHVTIEDLVVPKPNESERTGGKREQT